MALVIDFLMINLPTPPKHRNGANMVTSCGEHLWVGGSGEAHHQRGILKVLQFYKYLCVVGSQYLPLQVSP